MQSTVFGRFVSLLIFSSLCMPFAYADFLIRPVPFVVVESAAPCCCKKPRYHKKHYVVKKHKYHHRRYAYRDVSESIPCVYHYYPQAEPVTFLPGAPSGRGRWVDTSGCDNYAPDMSTGDDDPTIYPGMNIDN